MSEPAFDSGEHLGRDLLDLVRPKFDRSRPLIQWALHAVTILALVRQVPALLGLGAVVFLLEWRGVRVRHAVSTKFFQSIPVLRQSDAPQDPLEEGLVTIIAPSRNEESEIEAAVRSLDAQRYDPLDVVIINDHSTDETGPILKRIEGELTRVRIFHNPPSAPGWIGKPNAVRFGMEQLSPDTRWLLFVDGDVILHPLALSAALARAKEAHADFLTCQPRLTTGTFAEKLMLPTIWRGIVSAVPYHKLNDSDTIPVGIGAFMLVRRDIYEKSGGHARFPHLHADDTLLAGSVRASGGRLDLALAPELMSIRLYCGWRQIFRTSAVKARTYSGDRLLYPLSMLAAFTLPAALPLPLSAAAALSMVRAGAIDPWLCGYAVSSFLVYWRLARQHRGIETVTDVTPSIGWLHPLAAWARVMVFVNVVMQMLFQSPRYWRGREEAGEVGKL